MWIDEKKESLAEKEMPKEEVNGKQKMKTKKDKTERWVEGTVDKI